MAKVPGIAGHHVSPFEHHATGKRTELVNRTPVVTAATRFSFGPKHSANDWRLRVLSSLFGIHTATTQQIPFPEQLAEGRTTGETRAIRTRHQCKAVTLCYLGMRKH